MGAYFFLVLASGCMVVGVFLSCFSLFIFSFFAISCLRRLSLSFLPVSPTGDLLLVSSLITREALHALRNLSRQTEYTSISYSQGDYFRP